MADPARNRRRLTGRIIFLALGAFIIFTHLIPLETVPPSLGGSTLDPISTVASPAAEDGPQSQSDAVVLSDPVRWIAPDLLILLTMAWVTRRPAFVPVLAIAGLFLLADMLFQRPPGLWTALVLIATEFLRRRARYMRTLPFWLEWLTVGAVITAITTVYTITIMLVLVPHTAFGLTIVHLMLTLMMYPVVVFVSYALFGVSRPAPGEVDALGHRM